MLLDLAGGLGRVCLVRWNNVFGRNGNGFLYGFLRVRQCAGLHLPAVYLAKGFQRPSHERRQVALASFGKPRHGSSHDLLPLCVSQLAQKRQCLSFAAAFCQSGDHEFDVGFCYPRLCSR